MKNNAEKGYYLELVIPRHQLLSTLLENAVQKRDWEKIASLIELNPTFMEEGLTRVYPILPVDYKFSIPLNCYIHHGYGVSAVCKCVRQARELMPIERRMPAELAALPSITVYRAGAEPLSEAASCNSWTTEPLVARWYYEQARISRQRTRHIYRGVIEPEDVIWYTNDRQEREIVQYRGVKQIEEIDPASIPNESPWGQATEN